ncbi:hypothetical protein GCM10017714_09160 [Curtobacterium pusillum]|uniref:Uncharacterized protein n=1 Tax=Curtobacterium pusillum TaxID=69373 RepID=A0ABX2M370_9MICO|nr:hypothetical protein [Curtobacterium pusillum]NUU12584.1 hypothetical protein [Curtobacterium pusillum]GLK30178.1 hypothetical protein GCM10017610_04630 [Curtobacterium pusillum]
MPPTRLQRNGATLDDVRAAVRAEFGAGARIVAAERVTTPGIGGLFRKAHVEATVEVPSPDEVPTARVAIADGADKRVGIAALLADAEEAEARIAGGDGTASTRADAFASVLDGFVADGITTGAPRPTSAPPDAGSTEQGGSRLQAAAPRTGGAARPVPPAVRSADGDLVLLVGRPNDVDAVAGIFAARYALRPTDAADRRSGILARAEGVRDRHALLGVAAWDDVATVHGLAPDQLWVVVDVGRKPADSEAMLAAVAGRASVAGVVAIGAGETATPESVHLLGVPVLSLG